MSRSIPIDPFLQIVFLQEIEDQCKMAIVAFANLKKGIYSIDANLCWGLIQKILTSAANISKIFWPAYDEDRAEKMKYIVYVLNNIN
jgi:hypothetical protein